MRQVQTQPTTCSNSRCECRAGCCRRAELGMGLAYFWRESWAVCTSAVVVGVTSPLHSPIRFRLVPGCSQQRFMSSVVCLDSLLGNIHPSKPHSYGLTN